ncbi:MAG: PIG-L family deacetylase [Chitinophagaceae bacterium]|nr:PIG-L family deacetylase [Chitinophagaceae bacterium]
MKKCSLMLLTVFACTMIRAQAPQSWTSAEMYQAIRKLNVLGSVLYVAAHPDDENTRLIAYFSKDRLYRTGYLSMTRGDGGQNLIGNDQGIDLGLIRTQELLSARRIDGGEQFFTRAFDFGFSKNPEETFTKWDKEKILSDVVWVIRKFQPDVIVTRFPTTGEGGHGHHTASAILANEAFTAAADPNRFPEQLKYVKPWQAKRICWNTFNFGSVNTQANDQFHFDVGGYNPLLGKSYGEIAATSRSQHKSQGFGVPASRGEAIEYFKTTGGTAPAEDLLDGIDQTWSRVPGAENVAQQVNAVSAGFDFMHPEKSVKALVELYKLIAALPEGYWRTKKLAETQTLIEQCSGLFMDATTSEVSVAQTDSAKIIFVFNNRLGTNTMLKHLSVDGFDSSFTQLLGKNKNLVFDKKIYVPASRTITEPYWLEEKMETGYYNVLNLQKIGQPDVDPSYEIKITLNIEGYDFVFRKPVKYKFTDPVKGELYEPFVVLPAYTLRISPDIIIGTDKFHVDKTFTSNKAGNAVSAGYAVKNEMRLTDTILLGKNEIRTAIENSGIEFPPGPLDKEGSSYRYHENRTYTDTRTGQELHDRISIKYDHIPYINYFKPSTADIRLINLVTYGKKIGYITGAGDKVPEALEQMGFEVTILTEKDLAKIPLAQFDAILTGVRAYNTNEWMNAYYDKLMAYVNNGGNLIVQYNTSNQIGPVRAKISPYPFDISRTRVTDENADVSILKPEHPVLNFPNKITNEDFKGWIQERSIYHASNFDKTKFETIFSMHDPGEKDDEGSLIIGKYGKGYFTYTGIVFFRELPAGVPGAYRLLANLIALNKKKGF